MANKLQIKRSAVPGKAPTTADLDLGELAINTYDGKAYMKKNVSGVETVVLLTGAGAGDVLGPASSGDNAIARFDATSGKIIQNSSATVDDSGNINALTMQASGTGANKMPVGTTAQRPGTPAVGMYRMNTTLGTPEWWDASTSSWVSFSIRPPYVVEYLIVAGGGGGDGTCGGGGGAGGMITGSMTIQADTVYGVSVGAGGSGAPCCYDGNYGTKGGNSTALGLTAIGGGGGTGGDRSGGSGIGAMRNVSNAGSGTAGQGNGGAPYQSYDNIGGGGGGKGAAATTQNGGVGQIWPSGGSTYYAGGGGGGARIGWTPGSGGAGGGGSGQATNNGSPASANTGGGGGAGGYQSGAYYAGGNGGSGIVIFRYLGAQRGTGGTVTSDGTYTYHTFTSSGSFTS